MPKQLEVASPNCEDLKQAKTFELFEAIPTQITATGWGHYRNAIICDNRYFIEEYWDWSGPLFYGPFEFQISIVKPAFQG